MLKNCQVLIFTQNKISFPIFSFFCFSFFLCVVLSFNFSFSFSSSPSSPSSSSFSSLPLLSETQGDSQGTIKDIVTWASWWSSDICRPEIRVKSIHCASILKPRVTGWLRRGPIVFRGSPVETTPLYWSNFHVAGFKAKCCFYQRTSNFLQVSN